MTSSVLRVFRPLVLVFVIACSGEQTPQPLVGGFVSNPLLINAAFRTAVRQATMVFVGTIVQRGASTEEGLNATRLMTIVQVDSVLRGPPGAGNFAGSRLTVVSAPSDTAKLVVGQRATFFSYGLAAGESLIVRGTLSFDASTPDSINRVAAAFREAVQLDADTALAVLARRAHLVVRAVVGQQTPVAVPDSILRRYGNERSPQWWQVALTSTAFVGGDSTLLRPSVDMYYPVGEQDDRRWPNRLSLGDTLIFLLRRASDMPAGIRRVVVIPERFFLMDSAAVLPPSDSTRVRSVLR